MTCLVRSSEVKGRYGTYRPALTKIISPTEIKPFPNVAKYDLLNIYIGSFDELSDLIQFLSSQRDMALVRGRAIIEGPNQFRRLRARAGESATIEPVAEGLRWVMFDIDKYPLPPFLEDTDQILDILTDELPEPFRDASYVYQWSSKAFLDGKFDFASGHLFFWLARPRTCEDLHRRTLQGDWSDGVIDPAPFVPNQLHYTAAPVFKEGAADPLTIHRTGVRIGMFEEVELDPWVPPVRPPCSGTGCSPNNLSAMIAAIGEDGHIHAAARNAAYAYIRTTPTLLRDEAVFVDQVLQRVAAAGRADDYDGAYVQRMMDTAKEKLT
ncbi:hypothetical protein HME9302_02108 [Alteripontixanthobacter maritimus]|uniref:Uncharacterized protein n=1 Tax=Alteripontixanthobacter maritimus TaxID=2161824 RepID=A0A369Q8T7_9SPHN|nr:hypothetical protein [Alteripontixanthobacter maritimus]RDC60892.1 hypothetical protein HME9302_02108 [Alteripontixanthobacter maritimus]